MYYLFLAKEYKDKEAKYSRIVQPHLETIQSIEDPRPLFEQFGRHPIFKKKVDNLRGLLQEHLVVISNISTGRWAVTIAGGGGCEDKRSNEIV